MHPGDPVPTSLRAALDAVRSRAGDLGATLVYLAVTGSTNDVATRLAADGAPTGTLVVASEQTKGRGRQGRSWFSPRDAGVYFSIVFRGRTADQGGRDDGVGERLQPDVCLITLAAGVAAAEGVERATGVRARIKWPNDLVVEDEDGDPGAGSRRKLAGILAEGSVAGGVLQHVVVGIGINVRDSAYPLELAGRVTSLEREAGREVDGFRVLAECLASLNVRWHELRWGAHERVLDEWRRRSPSSRGAPVIVDGHSGPAQGVTVGLREDGALMVNVGGEIRPVVAGEVRWV
jgi:BirA family biotin operon repressor/biotin-[acetyl-CoA-carboxylase] ligase